MAQSRKRKISHTSTFGAQKKAANYVSGALKRRKGPIENARQTIQRNGEDLLQLLKRGQTQSRPERGPAVSKHRAKAGSTTSTKDMKDLRNEMFHIMGLLKQTVQTYEAMNRKTDNIEQPTWMRWERDGEDLEALNNSTRDTATFLLECLISPNRRDDKCSSTQFGVDRDIASLAWEILEAATPKMGSQTWGTCSREFFKAFVSIMRQMQ